MFYKLNSRYNILICKHLLYDSDSCSSQVDIIQKSAQMNEECRLCFNKGSRGRTILVKLRSEVECLLQLIDKTPYLPKYLKKITVKI